ncbi:MAG: HAD family hydrolase [Thermoplasmata archaeon]
MVGVSWKLLTLDLDGTLTTVHGWSIIADRAGRRAQYERSNRRFFAHEIGEDEHLHDLLEIAVGMTVNEVRDALGATPQLAGIPEAVRAAHDHGLRVALLTHNPTYVCAWYAERYGLDDFEGTVGAEIAGGRVAPVGPVHADKRAGLDRLTARLGISRERTVHVGDGWADAALFPAVGAGVALNSRFPEVRAAADLVLETDDLRTLLPALENLVPRHR